MFYKLIVGDCLDVMRTMEPNSVDAIVCDPPYGLSFMGKDWDHGVPGVQFWREALRVAKPGAHLLAFGGTRTFHRLAVAIEDAGWEIRDTIMWVYGSGFPKSHDVSKAIDREAGALGIQSRGANYAGGDYAPRDKRFRSDYGYTFTSTTPGAKRWQGWGTALKPAWEPIIVARKPLQGTVAANVLEWGTGAINVDGCRVGTDGGTKAVDFGETRGTMYGGGNGKPTNGIETLPAGRWPANVIHDGSDEVLAGFPVTTSGVAVGGKGKASSIYGTKLDRSGGADVGYGDTGSAARFFYTAKSSRKDRNEGLDSTCTVKYNVPIGGALCKDVSMALVTSLQRATSEQTVSWHIGESGASITGLCQLATLSTTLTAISRITTSQILSLLTPLPTNASIQAANSETANGGNHAGSAASLSLWTQNTTSGNMELVPGVELVVSQMLSTISDGENWKPLTNIHSTVKPIALMCYLVRLVTPPAGVVLDPFMGSGSTGKAAALEGFGFIGIDTNPEYVEIARRRIAAVELPLLTTNGGGA